MSNIVNCVAIVNSRQSICIPKNVCSYFNWAALKNMGIACDYEKKQLILEIRRDTARTALGASVSIYSFKSCGRTRITFVCRLRKTTMRALNLNAKDLVLVKAKSDGNGEGQIIIEKYEKERGVL